MRICGSADVHMCKMRISMRIKIRTLPVGQNFFCHKLFEKSPHTALLLLSVLQCNVDVYCSRLLF